MAKISFNGTVLAESAEPVIVEGNYYFAPEEVNMEFLTDSARDLKTVCPWKGTASYYDVNVDGETLRDAAWYYPEAKPAADRIKGYIAFYKSRVEVED
ncbi:MAG: DUF427 domain-containing protein [Chloroflexota bacterium]